MDHEPTEPPAPSSDEFDVEAVQAGATRQAAASRTVTDHRKHIGPEKLEATLILWCNYDHER